MREFQMIQKSERRLSNNLSTRRNACASVELDAAGLNAKGADREEDGGRTGGTESCLWWSWYPFRNSVHVQDGDCSLPPDVCRLTLPHSPFLPLSLSRFFSIQPPSRFRRVSPLPFNGGIAARCRERENAERVAWGSRCVARRRLGVPTV